VAVHVASLAVTFPQMFVPSIHMDFISTVAMGALVFEVCRKKVLGIMEKNFVVPPVGIL
jgi:hypothetical protein